MFCKAKSGCIQLGSLVGSMLLARGSTLARDVHYNFMAGKDFSKYHTYNWITIPIPENVHPNQIVRGSTRPWQSYSKNYPPKP